MPKRTVVWGATGASCRYAIHSPVTKRLMGDRPGRTNTYPSPKLSGNVVEDPFRQSTTQVASPDFAYKPRHRCRSTMGWTERRPTGRRSREV
jgi:hypothetical protein